MVSEHSKAAPCPSIETVGLCGGYGETIEGKEVIRDISLGLEPGSLVAIIGPNGSGKSTFLKHLIRELKAKEGRIFLCGNDISSMKQRDVARLIAFDKHLFKQSPLAIRQCCQRSGYSFFIYFRDHFFKRICRIIGKSFALIVHLRKRIIVSLVIVFLLSFRLVHFLKKVIPFFFDFYGVLCAVRKVISVFFHFFAP